MSGRARKSSKGDFNSQKCPSESEKREINGVTDIVNC